MLRRGTTAAPQLGRFWTSYIVKISPFSGVDYSGTSTKEVSLFQRLITVEPLNVDILGTNEVS